VHPAYIVNRKEYDGTLALKKAKKYICINEQEGKAEMIVFFSTF